MVLVLLRARLWVFPHSITARQLFQMFSVSLWGVNAALWLHRYTLQSPPSLTELTDFVT